MKNFLARTWAEINLDNIISNINVVKSRTKDTTKIMSVVKADAYGHGVKYIAPLLSDLSDWFAVSNIEEALQLRGFGNNYPRAESAEEAKIYSQGIIRKPVLILGYTPQDMAEQIYINGFTQTVFSLEYAEKLSKVCNNKIDIHIKIDTGMSRLGFMAHREDEILPLCENISEINTLPNLNITGIYTHFPSADFDGDVDGIFTKKQYELFSNICNITEQKIGKKILKHCCNSAGVLNFPEFQMDMVRPGIMLYGLHPAGEICEDLKPAMSLKSVVSMVKTIKKGDTVSYGRTFLAQRDMTVATIPIGYADGYVRALSGKAKMLVNGKYADVLGRVCMDQTVIDVSDIFVKQGDEVTVFGGGLSIDEISRIAGTINYETVCLVGKRVPRIFYKSGAPVGEINYILESGSVKY